MLDANTPKRSLRSRLPIAILLLAVLTWFVVSCYQQSRPLPPDLVAWRDYESGMTAAREEGKPVFLYFTGESWCPPCRTMQRNVLTDPDVADRLNGAFIPIKIDFKTPSGTDQQRALKQQYGISGTPTSLVLTSDGAVLVREAGSMPKGDFLALLGSALPEDPAG